jgi:hypothetical protein
MTETTMTSPLRAFAPSLKSVGGRPCIASDAAAVRHKAAVARREANAIRWQRPRRTESVGRRSMGIA